MNLEELKYPTGKFEFGKTYSEADNKNHILIIEEFPKELKLLALSLTPAQLEQTYRPDGWTGRQVIHHLADSHINAYIRVKLALTEDTPAIKPYHEELFAELADGKSAPIDSSLAIIEAVHLRWVYLLKALTLEDLQRKYIHPQYNREFKLNEFLALYAWHGKHHYGHLKLITGK